MLTRTCLIALLALILVAADKPDADPKARFATLAKESKDVRKSPDWEKIKRRRDIVVELSDLDDPRVERLLFECFREDREQVCRIPAMIGLGKRGRYPVLKATVTTALRDRNEVYIMTLPDSLRHSKDEKIGPWLMRGYLKQKRNPVLKAAVIQSLGLLKCEEAYEPIHAILTRETRDERATYECMLALARIGGQKAYTAVRPFLSNSNRHLREGAVIALGECGHQQAIGAILPLAKDVDPRTQEAVAEVIGRQKAEEGIPALIGLLRTGRLRVIDTARRNLEEMTGEKFGIDADAWEKWRKDKQAGKTDPKQPPTAAKSVASYYGLRIFSDRVLFILDVSGSMDAGEPPRIDTAREELTKTLEQLNRKTLFNVVGFSGATMWWKDAEVEATPKNIDAAKEFVAKLSVGGGTNVSDTFEEAFEKNRLVDTIYFLGDGSPSVGRHTEQEEILARVRWMNRFRKVRIHCIALIRGEVSRFGGRAGPGLGRGRSISGARAYDEEEAARFLARLAAEHGGDFVKIDDEKK
jgi:hypothetical protein